MYMHGVWMFDIIITLSSTKYENKIEIKIMLNAPYKPHVFLDFEMNCHNIVFFKINYDLTLEKTRVGIKGTCSGAI